MDLPPTASGPEPTDPAAPGPAGGDRVLAPPLNLKQVAQRLDVHYMTAYRYVRHGRLPARREAGMWFVDAADVEEFLAAPARPAVDVDWADRLVRPLAAGDEVAAWTVVRDAMSAGHDYGRVHLEVVAGALATIGVAVEAGRRSPVEERIATSVAARLIARLGALGGHRGRKLGTVVVATPPGEHHGLALALVANLVRAAGFRVIELGTDAPAAAVVDAVASVDDAVAVGLSVTTADRLAEAGTVMAAVRAAHPGLPVLIGGQAVRNEDIAALVGATSWSVGPDLVATLTHLATRRPTPTPH